MTVLKSGQGMALFLLSLAAGLISYGVFYGEDWTSLMWIGGGLVLFAAGMDSLFPLLILHRDLSPIGKRRILGKSGVDLPSPYPNGWYLLLYSFELPEAGEVRLARALGREFAVWRDVKGKVNVFDATCPHLGANLGVGGVVDKEKNVLRCPFHGWGFNSDGTVMDIPGCGEESVLSCSKIAKATKYIAVERNEMILVWMASESLQDSPQYQVPVEPCFASLSTPVEEEEEEEKTMTKSPLTQTKPDLSAFDGTLVFSGIVEHVVRCHIQEIPENGADGAHLLTVHAPFVIEWLSGWLDHSWNFQWIPGTKEHGEQQRAVVLMDLGTLVFGRKFQALNISVHTTQVGPSLVHEYLTFPFGLGTVYFASSVTPVKPLVQRYTHTMWGPRWLPRFVPKLLLRGLAVQVERDIPIWNFKAFQPRPPYSKLDSNIPKFRRWYSQFYSDDSISFEEARQNEENQFYEW